jgi:hypothetical protein
MTFTGKNGEWACVYTRYPYVQTLCRTQLPSETRTISSSAVSQKPSALHSLGVCADGARHSKGVSINDGTTPSEKGHDKVQDFQPSYFSFSDRDICLSVLDILDSVLWIRVGNVRAGYDGLGHWYRYGYVWSSRARCHDHAGCEEHGRREAHSDELRRRLHFSSATAGSIRA